MKPRGSLGGTDTIGLNKPKMAQTLPSSIGQGILHQNIYTYAHVIL